jgi:phosphohistidine phosphatase SixA
MNTRHWYTRRFCFWTTAMVLSVPSSALASDWSRIGPGTIVLFRHANAPGGGDPPGFKLNDCSTQRNLDAVGRAQAQGIGAVFRERGIPVQAVLSSQWCRTRDTAELAFPGQWKDEPAFNSFFQAREQEAAQTQKARAVLQRWQGPGVMVVVTHQVNITALTGGFTSPGEGVVVRVAGGELKVLGRIQP